MLYDFGVYIKKVHAPSTQFSCSISSLNVWPLSKYVFLESSHHAAKSPSHIESQHSVLQLKDLAETSL